MRPEVPAELAALVAKMMAKEPDRRFQTPAEVAAALGPFFKKEARTFKYSSSLVSEATAFAAEPAHAETDRPSIHTAADADLTPAPATEVPPSTNPPESKWFRMIEDEEPDVDRTAAARPRGRRLELFPDYFISLLQFGVIVIAYSMPDTFWIVVGAVFLYVLVPLGIIIAVPFILIGRSIHRGMAVAKSPFDPAYLEPWIRTTLITLGASLFVTVHFLTAERDWSAVFLILGTGAAVLALDGANPLDRAKYLAAYSRVGLGLIGACLVAVWISLLFD